MDAEPEAIEAEAEKADPEDEPLVRELDELDPPARVGLYLDPTTVG